MRAWIRNIPTSSFSWLIVSISGCRGIRWLLLVLRWRKSSIILLVVEWVLICVLVMKSDCICVLLILTVMSFLRCFVLLQKLIPWFIICSVFWALLLSILPRSILIWIKICIHRWSRFWIRRGDRAYLITYSYFWLRLSVMLISSIFYIITSGHHNILLSVLLVWAGWFWRVVILGPVY